MKSPCLRQRYFNPFTLTAFAWPGISALRIFQAFSLADASLEWKRRCVAFPFLFFRFSCALQARPEKRSQGSLGLKSPCLRQRYFNPLFQIFLHPSDAAGKSAGKPFLLSAASCLRKNGSSGRQSRPCGIYVRDTLTNPKLLAPSRPLRCEGTTGYGEDPSGNESRFIKRYNIPNPP